MADAVKPRSPLITRLIGLCLVAPGLVTGHPYARACEVGKLSDAHVSTSLQCRAGPPDGEPHSWRLEAGGLVGSSFARWVNLHAALCDIRLAPVTTIKRGSCRSSAGICEDLRPN